MIEGIGGPGALKGPLAPAAAPKAAPAEGERSFKEILQDSLSSVNQLQKDADLVLEKYTKGQATLRYKKTDPRGRARGAGEPVLRRRDLAVAL